MVCSSPRYLLVFRLNFSRNDEHYVRLYGKSFVYTKVSLFYYCLRGVPLMRFSRARCCAYFYWYADPGMSRKAGQVKKILMEGNWIWQTQKILYRKDAYESYVIFSSVLFSIKRHPCKGPSEKGDGWMDKWMGVRAVRAISLPLSIVLECQINNAKPLFGLLLHRWGNSGLL